MLAKHIGWVLVGIALLLLVSLSFVKVDNDKTSEFLCTQYQNLDLDMENCPAHNSRSSWFIFLGFGLAFLILGGGLYFVFAPAPELMQAKKDFRPVDLQQLDAEEQKIYTVLKAKEGSAYQTDLIKETQFSKVKITRLLDKMESKGILERKRMGMTNIVVLK